MDAGMVPPIAFPPSVKILSRVEWIAHASQTLRRGVATEGAAFVP